MSKFYNHLGALTGGKAIPLGTFRLISFVTLRHNILHTNQYEMTFRFDKYATRSSQSRNPPFTLFPPWLLRQ